MVRKEWVEDHRVESVGDNGGVEDPLRPLAECQKALHHAALLHANSDIHWAAFIPNLKKSIGYSRHPFDKDGNNVSPRGKSPADRSSLKNNEGGTVPTHSPLTLHPRGEGATESKGNVPKNAHLVNTERQPTDVASLVSVSKMCIEKSERKP